MVEVLSLIVALSSLVVAYIIYYNNAIGDVVVYAQVDKTRPTVINLVIHNIGKGIAKDIHFICPTGIPKKAYGISGLTDPLKLYDSGAFINGLPILFSDEKLIYSWGQYGGLKEALNGTPLEIEITFYSRTNLQLIKRKIKNKVVIDPTAFEGVDISESSFEREVKIALKDIAKHLEKISS